MKDPAWFAPPWGRVLGQDATLMPVFPFANRALPISKARAKHEPLVLQRTNKHTTW